MEHYYEMLTMFLEAALEDFINKMVPELGFIGWVKLLDKVKAPMHSFVSLFS